MPSPSWRGDRNPPPEPEPLTLKEASTEIASHGLNLERLNISAVLGWIFIIIVLGMSLMLMFAPAKSKPVATQPSTTDTRLEAKIDSLGNLVSAQRDSLKLLRTDLQQALADSRAAVSLTEQRAHDLDVLRTDVNRLQINGPGK